MASIDGPDDPEQRNVIDKLAAFVARNGPDFEAMTREKQKDNPHFAFLFPGHEHYVFFKKRCIEEQVKLKNLPRAAQQPSEKPLAQPHLQLQPQQQLPGGRPSRFSAVPSGAQPSNGDLIAQINELKERLATMRTQLETERVQSDAAIRESETNLRGQHAALTSKQQLKIEEALRAARGRRLSELAAACALPPDELDSQVDNVAAHCTKDNIQSAKAFILNALTNTHNAAIVGELMATYLQQRVLQRDTPFVERLHILYLVNDLLHHINRKQQDEMRIQLERVIVSMMYTMKQQAPDEDNKQKLEKLIIIWAQSRYFTNEILEALQDVDGKLLQSAYQNYLMTFYRTIIDEVNSTVQREYAEFQTLHSDFVATTEAQLAERERNLEELQKQLAALEHRLAESAAISRFAPPANSVPVAVPVPNAQGPLNFPPGLIGPPPAGMPPLPVGFNPAIPPPPFTSAPPGDFPFRQPPSGPGPGLPFVPRFPGPRGPIDFSRPPPPFVPIGAPGPGLLGNGPPMTLPLGGPVPLMSIQFAARFPDPYHQSESRSSSRSSSRSRSRSRSRSSSRSSSRSRYTASPDSHLDHNWASQLAPDAVLGVGDAEQDSSCDPVYSEADLIPNVPYYLLPAGLMVPLVGPADCEYAPLDPSVIRLPPPRRPDARLLAALEAFYAPASRENPRDADGWEKLGLFEFYKAKEQAKKKQDSTIVKREHDNGERDAAKRRRTDSSSRKRSRSKSGSKSRSRSRSRERERDRDRSRSVRSGSGDRAHRKSRSRSSSPARRNRVRESEAQRSPSPSSFTPSFSFATPMTAALKTPLDTSANKGAQLMAKMGWTGAGLGATDQGRVEPVPIDEVRSGSDLHKGVGLRVNDPFEQFRRSMSEQVRSRWSSASK